MPGILKAFQTLVPHSKQSAVTQERDPETILPSEKDGKALHPDLLNPRLLEAQYAVRGELYLRAEQLKKTKEIIYTNGNPRSASPGSFTIVPTLLSTHDAVTLSQLATRRRWELSPSLLSDRYATSAAVSSHTFLAISRRHIVYITIQGSHSYRTLYLCVNHLAG